MWWWVEVSEKQVKFPYENWAQHFSVLVASNKGNLEAFVVQSRISRKINASVDDVTMFLLGFNTSRNGPYCWDTLDTPVREDMQKWSRCNLRLIQGFWWNLHQWRELWGSTHNSIHHGCVFSMDRGSPRGWSLLCVHWVWWNIDPDGLLFVN